MIEYLKLENVADERGEEPAKVARTLLRIGCDLYLRFGSSRESRSGVSFFPDHPAEQMEHNIGPGNHPLTKDSQEVVIKRLGRSDTTTEGLLVWIYTKVDSSITVPYQIELMEQDDSVCVVVHPDDVTKLTPPSTFQTAPGSMYPDTPEKIFFENSEKETISGKHKPHTAYVALEKKDGTKRGDAWNKLKRLASESKGAKQIELNGFGKIYLKRDRENPETILRYKHTEFEQPDDGNQITKGAFDMAWSS